MIEAVKPPWELDLQFPELKFEGLEPVDLALPPLSLPTPTPKQEVEANTAEAGRVLQETEERLRDDYIARHRRETEIKPELGGLIW